MPPPPASWPPLLLDHRMRRAEGSPRAHVHTGLASGLQPIGWRVSQAGTRGEPSTRHLCKCLLKEPLPQDGLQAEVSAGRQLPPSPQGQAHPPGASTAPGGTEAPSASFSLSPAARDPPSKDVSGDARPGQRQLPVLENLELRVQPSDPQSLILPGAGGQNSRADAEKHGRGQALEGLPAEMAPFIHSCFKFFLSVV